ncbi:MAG TPA: BON domain-containing protein [Puia sp.]|nr:BON domain-containing protein [Puia sp.]
MKESNDELQQDVQDAIQWETSLNTSQIGVIAKDGVVTLTGTVDSYAKKLEAEEAAKNVKGVKAVVVKLDIKFGSDYEKKDDSEIAGDIIQAAKWNWDIPKDKIKAKVENGWVTLEGEVDYNYQRDAIEDLVKNHSGITGVTNNIAIEESDDQIEKKDIEKALRRNWFIDDSHIVVTVSDHEVTLNGSVESWYERRKAERIAYNAPGVWNVNNQLVIAYDYEFVD